MKLHNPNIKLKVKLPKNEISETIKNINNLYVNNQLSPVLAIQYKKLQEQLRNFINTSKTQITYLYQSEEKVKNDIVFFNEKLKQLNEFSEYESKRTEFGQSEEFPKIKPIVDEILNMLMIRLGDIQTIGNALKPEVDKISLEVNEKLQSMKLDVDNLKKSI